MQCSIIVTNINLSNFNTQNVINMNLMFCNCESLSKLDLSNFNSQNITEEDFALQNCISLKTKKIITKDNVTFFPT